MRTPSNALLLGIVTVASIAGGVTLAALNRAVPDYLPTLATVSLGALAGVALPGPTPAPSPAPLPTSFPSLETVATQQVAQALSAHLSAHEAATGTITPTDPPPSV